MPKSNNDCRYKGSEPSPKGFGFCAHLQPVGTRKKGRDGLVWIVKTDKNGTKRWFREKQISSLPRITKITHESKKTSKGTMIRNVQSKQTLLIPKDIQSIIDDDDFWNFMKRYDSMYEKNKDDEEKVTNFLKGKSQYIHKYDKLLQFLFDVMFSSNWATKENGNTPYCGADDTHSDFIRWMVRKGKRYVHTFLTDPFDKKFAESCRSVDSQLTPIDHENAREYDKMKGKQSLRELLSQKHGMTLSPIKQEALKKMKSLMDKGVDKRIKKALSLVKNDKTLDKMNKQELVQFIRSKGGKANLGMKKFDLYYRAGLLLI